MAGSTAYNQKPKPSPIVIGSKDIGTGTLLTQKSGINLMQNCDLPPPLKVFPGNDMMVVLQSKKRICSMTPQKEENVYGASGFSNEKLELLKALRLSQTRAREAERRAAVLREERDAISNALLHESSRLIVYRHWVKLLELQVSTLRRQHQEPICGGTIKKKDDNEGGGSMVWIVALALGFSIASLGFTFGGPTLILNLFSFG